MSRLVQVSKTIIRNEFKIPRNLTKHGLGRFDSRPLFRRAFKFLKIVMCSCSHMFSKTLTNNSGGVYVRVSYCERLDTTLMPIWTYFFFIYYECIISFNNIFTFLIREILGGFWSFQFTWQNYLPFGSKELSCKTSKRTQFLTSFFQNYIIIV